MGKSNMSKLIYHIYWGTSGISGLYLDEIYKCLKDNGFNQKAYVSYYYPFDYGEKVFFRYSDMARCKVKGIVRKVLQGIETVYAFAIILLRSKIEKPSVINFSLVGVSKAMVFHFLKTLKRLTGCKLVVTCHDVCPWRNTDDKSSEMINRRRIFDLSDYLLVHNDSSVNDLENVFNIKRDKIIKHLFPIMDMTKLYSDETKAPKEYDYLFIGHLRKDKGIELLIEAWKLFHKKNDKATLCICGRPQEQKYDVESLKKWKITCVLRYVSDDDYFRYVQSARYVIFPYKRGTNSGVLSTVLSLGTDVITSDIPMFSDNPLVKKENMFKTGDVDSLIQLLDDKYHEKKIDDVHNTIVDYRRLFADETVNVYSLITGAIN